MTTGDDESPKKMKFHFVKGALHRVIHVDGVFGGPTPNGHLHMALFSERYPIPTQVEHALVPLEGGAFKLGQEDTQARKVKPGILRELEISATMDLDTAKALHGWLAEKIKVLEAKR